MLLWLLFALLTVAVLGVLLRPLTRPAAPADAAYAADIAVYKDQLAEIDADVARGLVQPADAALARSEVARRLLSSAPADSSRSSVVTSSSTLTSGATASGLSPRIVAMGLMALLPLLAIGSYTWLGSPHLPSVPFQAQQAPLQQAPVAELVAMVEARLATNPNDGAGWDAIAPVYFRLQRHADAARAYERAALLLGETPQRLAGFAEALVLANDGIVTEPARFAYEKLNKADPSRIEPRFWLALAKEQDGQRAAAATDYRALLAAAPPDATWRPLVEERLAAVGGPISAPEPALKSPPSAAPGAATRGPTADDIAAAGKLSDADRGQMIRGMVEGLAKRLAENPNDVQGWVRLVQSYSVLGERDRARASLAEAQRRLAGNPQALADLAALGKSLGVGP